MSFEYLLAMEKLCRWFVSSVTYRLKNDSLFSHWISVPQCILVIGISRYAREISFIPELLPPAFFLLWRFVFKHRFVAQAKKSASTCQCTMSRSLSRWNAP